ncbi:FAD-dependent oxidoreductase [Candidatus Pelagibacter sp.]|jgi:hypothetical protein|nr:FAD-dependent oxidoreductase [Candidatus Pelagibacter sp.]
MKIGIIGAGWFGCHIGSELLKDGHDVFIYEKEKEIFYGASGNNQNRLHLGFHYPRSFLTRKQSKEGFKIFQKKYPSFCVKVKNNLYAISKKKENIVDFETYLQILKSSGLSYKKLNQNKYNIKNISGLIKCDEKFINIEKAKLFFLKKLKNRIKFNYKIKNLKKINNKFLIDEHKFDFIINCTWQQFLPQKKWNLSYELCISALYKNKKKDLEALTIMDGPFYTLYPFSKNVSNLYSVKHSRYKISSEFNLINKKLKSIKNIELKKFKNTIEKEFSEYYPNFKKEYKFFKFLKTYRTLINKKDDSRDYKLIYKNGVFNVLSGKVDHIFLVSNDIKKCIKNFS